MKALVYTGGLGDIVNKFYYHDGYNTLTSDISVVIHSHNPFVYELFTYHPAHPFLHILEWDWTNTEKPVGFEEYGKVAEQKDVVFYPSVSDRRVLAGIPKDYIVTSFGAGEESRCWPCEYARDVFKAAKIPVCNVGRSYGNRRSTRYEVPGSDCIDLIDALSIPGTFELVRHAKAVITSHSALCILAQRMNKRILLGTPRFVYDANWNDKPHRDSYCFGLKRPGNTEFIFDEYNAKIIQSFLASL